MLDLGLLPKRGTKSSYCPSNNKTNAIRGGMGVLRLTVHIGGSIHISASEGQARVEGALAESQIDR